ncbi:hypothetical protein [Candidatus Pelagisphaera phototrophica]|uniref:hypothetical protein n=1 Tax=Candidatus Pelagisphaera phototrophica TaxID=2684113 RepID=UPI0019F6FF60|nr:hypothetical protein [Candidatus Pelagisphaera phototrophica]QXD33009.1 hypothetical protein GA004_04660 [Candidatus Pelagisphaera phototrophica]
MKTRTRKIVKDSLKKISPPIYSYLLEKNLENQLPPRYKNRMPTSFVMEDRNAGFFSLFFQVVGALKFCEERGSNLTINFNTGPYVEREKGINWWSYYFESDSFRFNQQHARIFEITDREEQCLFSNYGRNLPIKEANKIVSQIKIKRELTSKVSTFAEKNFKDKKIIGIHYRGTDKVSGKRKESDRVPYEYITQHLEGYGPEYLFFLASDESQFLNAMQDHFHKRVCFYNAIRSDNGTALHNRINNYSMYKIGEDALIDCLLLSQCEKLIRTDSNLSLACSFFNPDQQVINITKEFMRRRSHE